MSASPAQRLEAAHALAGGATIAATARSIEISPRTIHRWLQTDAFPQAVERARRQQAQAVLDADRKRARCGIPPDPAANEYARPELSPPCPDPEPRPGDVLHQDVPLDLDLLAAEIEAHRLDSYSAWMDSQDLRAGRPVRPRSRRSPQVRFIPL